MNDRRAFFDERAAHRPRESARYYHRLLERYYTFLVPPGARVLEVGCGLGDLLAAVQPAEGFGVDSSKAIIALAQERHPELQFQVADALEIPDKRSFDYILLSDLVNDLPDVQAVLASLRQSTHPRTRLVMNFVNNLWHPALFVAEKIGAKAAGLSQNWLSLTDMMNLCHLAGWEVIKTDARILWPLRTPVVATVLNRWLAPLLKHLCLTMFVVARPRRAIPDGRHYRCTVVVPARNEAGNIEAAVLRTPEMGLGTEVIFIEGGSTDHTREELARVKASHPGRDIKLMTQHGVGKGTAVREALAAATGDLLFVLDADLTVPPEELPKFYEVARTGLAEFVNGVRLVYPMEHEAMRFLNMVANKCFSLGFSWLLGQRIKDTLCGTKVLFRADYEAIARNRAYFGDFDPYGDFDLLFGAAKLNLRILDLPIRYQARTYGTTNIHRWRHGRLLLRMALFAAARLKFV